MHHKNAKHWPQGHPILTKIQYFNPTDLYQGLTHTIITIQASPTCLTQSTQSNGSRLWVLPNRVLLDLTSSQTPMVILLQQGEIVRQSWPPRPRHVLIPFQPNDHSDHGLPNMVNVTTTSQTYNTSLVTHHPCICYRYPLALPQSHITVDPTYCFALPLPYQP